MPSFDHPLFPTTDEAKLYGQHVGEALRYAADKAALAREIKQKKFVKLNPYIGSSYNMGDIRLKQIIAREKAIREDKLSSSMHTVAYIIAAQLILKVSDLDSRETWEGTLSAIDINTKEMTLNIPNEIPQSLVYAREVPVPEHIEQSYYGTELIIDIDVVELPIAGLHAVMY